MNFWKKNKSALSFLAEILIPYRKMLFFFVIGNILGGGFSALMPYLAKIEIDQLMNRHIFSFQTLTFDAYKYFIIIVVIIFCISILEKLITQIHELITGKYERIFIKDLSVKVYRRMCNIRLGYYLNNRIKKIISDSYFTPEDILNK
jgi:ABC-type multidrug transport system fused ATPase/permease subunit